MSTVIRGAGGPPLPDQFQSTDEEAKVRPRSSLSQGGSAMPVNLRALEKSPLSTGRRPAGHEFGAAPVSRRALLKNAAVWVGAATGLAACGSDSSPSVQEKQRDIVNLAICEEQEISAIQAQNGMIDNFNLNSDRNWLQQDVTNIQSAGGKLNAVDTEIVAQDLEMYQDDLAAAGGLNNNKVREAQLVTDQAEIKVLQENYAPNALASAKQRLKRDQSERTVP
ncbi:MAG: hypothetical protein KGQ57_18225 [Burkholderiales bacterium]|nr:hypothetical protein [Burkholderiales bacterium]